MLRPDRRAPRAHPARTARPARTAHKPRPEREARRLAAALEGWFGRARRDLPWRRDRDPWRVWVSETMLQQTTVKVVVPYYERFMARFPTVVDLARAPVDEVLGDWSGLGYYRRARNLHAAARRVVAEHGGRVPDNREALLSLPGIGAYTAGAILSLAFGQREPVVDGNVTRVLARLAGERRDPRQGEAARRLHDTARRLVTTADHPGALNEALMELGATVCTPAAPGCDRCPVAAPCAARAAGIAERIPPPRRERAPVAVRRTVALVERGGRFLVRRRRGTTLMDGLWELPVVETDGRGGHRLESGPALAGVVPAGTFRHSITWRRLAVRVVRARLDGAAPRHGHRWVTPAEARRLPSSSLLAKALVAAGRDQSASGR